METLERPAHLKDHFEDLAEQDLGLAGSLASRRILRSLTVSLGRNRPVPQKTESDAKSLLRHRIEFSASLNAKKSAAVVEYSRLMENVDQGFAFIRSKTGDDLGQVVDGFARTNHSLSERGALLQQLSRDYDDLLLRSSTAANEVANDRRVIEEILASRGNYDQRQSSFKTETDLRILQLKKVNAELDSCIGGIEDRLAGFMHVSHRMIECLAPSSYNRDLSFGGTRDLSKSMLGTIG